MCHLSVSEGGGSAAGSRISPRTKMGSSQKALISSVPRGLMGIRAPCLGLDHILAHV